jgi:hypothetical protein
MDNPQDILNGIDNLIRWLYYVNLIKIVTWKIVSLSTGCDNITPVIGHLGVRIANSETDLRKVGFAFNKRFFASLYS